MLVFSLPRVGTVVESVRVSHGGSPEGKEGVGPGKGGRGSGEFMVITFTNGPGRC